MHNEYFAHLSTMIIKENVQLQSFNSFRTKATAKLFCEPKTTEELTEIIRSFPNEKKIILGKGFNTFFTKDYEGLVIRPCIFGKLVTKEDSRHIEMEVGAAEDWDQLVGYCVENGYSGVENLSLIPGSVGASPVQNIGAYGTEAKDVITEVKAVELSSGQISTFSNEACRFGYRDSLFKRADEYVIISVSFKLSKSFEYKGKYIDLDRELEAYASPTLSQVREAVIHIRNRKLPDYTTLPNAGSFFKNPIIDSATRNRLLEMFPDIPLFHAGEGLYKTSAAFLIDKAGYKGKRRGMVGTYERHSLIIVNYGTEKGQDIIRFMNEIKLEVKRKFGIALEPEVRIY